MNKRRSERKQTHIRVELTAGGKNYDAFIENVSFEGVGLNIILAPEEMIESIVPLSILWLRFQDGKAIKITLECKIKWVNISAEESVGVIYKIGSEIIDPPDEYKNFLRTL